MTSQGVGLATTYVGLAGVRNRPGVTPTRRLKRWENWLWSENPARAATCVREQLPSRCRSPMARSTRQTSAPGSGRRRGAPRWTRRQTGVCPAGVCLVRAGRRDPETCRIRWTARSLASVSAASRHPASLAVSSTSTARNAAAILQFVASRFQHPDDSFNPYTTPPPVA